MLCVPLFLDFSAHLLIALAFGRFHSSFLGAYAMLAAPVGLGIPAGWFFFRGGEIGHRLPCALSAVPRLAGVYFSALGQVATLASKVPRTPRLNKFKLLSSRLYLAIHNCSQFGPP